VDYAANRADVVAVSMSWGGLEFQEETTLDSHFISKNNAVFFASSGDSGWGASWPAASVNVVAVGGSSLKLKSDGSLDRESAWSGSGGGISRFENEPSYQSAYSIPRSGGKRAIPDVSYNADPASGFSVYVKGKWYILGGTSAGAPQWAAIQSLGGTAKNENFYTDKASAANANYFRDIVSGTNGNCDYYCVARKHYDYVTGLGSPITVNF
jgi:subtilase family serine protease